MYARDSWTLRWLSSLEILQSKKLDDPTSTNLRRRDRSFHCQETSCRIESVEPVYNDQVTQKVVVIHRWLLYSGNLCTNFGWWGIYVVVVIGGTTYCGRYRQVFVIQRCSQAQVSLYFKNTIKLISIGPMINVNSYWIGSLERISANEVHNNYSVIASCLVNFKNENNT